MSDFWLQTIGWVPCYGLVGAVLTLPWAIGVIRRTGPRPAAYFNILMTVFALAHGILVLPQALGHPPQSVVVPWLDTLDLHLSLDLVVSPVSMGAVLLVTGLSLLAQIFALGYLEKDWGLARFYALMGFFEGAMSGLALSDSLFLSYALLEMLTLSTYLLVGFWYAQPLVVTAARDAFLVKRVGDLILLMGVVALATFSGSLSFSGVADWATSADLDPWLAALLGLAVIAGPIGKCAQFPLHFWLDEAMEGPNPASILRNSVVVACGAYVLIKLGPLLSTSPLALDMLILLGGLTAVGASLVAIAQIDIKRALSHSTNAYLGLVFIAVGIQQPDIALELLFVHAFAKALLFMSAGGIILTTITQNLTEMGGLGSKMPATTTAFVVGSAGLMACLPLGGFWALLRFGVALWPYPALLLVLLAVNGLGALNAARLYRLIFAGQSQVKTRRAPEVAWPMAVPMVVLSVLTLLTPLMLVSGDLLPDWSSFVAQNQGILAVLLVVSSLVGMRIGGSIRLSRVWTRPVRPSLRFAQDLLAYDFYVDRFYRNTIVAFVAQGARWVDWFDRYVVDGLVNLVSLVSILGGEALRYTTSGRSQWYVLTILSGVLLSGILASRLFLVH